MSDAHHGHGAEAHGADAHHHDDFDPEPAQELSPGEPRTPGWVPVLGLALFVVAGLVLLVSGADEGSAEERSPAKAAPAAVAPPAATPARPAQLPVRPVPRPGQTAGQPVPPPQGAGQLQRISPEEMRRVQESLRQVQQRRQQGAQAQPPAPAPAPAPAPR